MGDMADGWSEIREERRERRERNLAAADPAGWTRHTEHHWSRMLEGKRLDYWPGRRKFQYDGRVMTGDVAAFIRKHVAKGDAPNG